jgi:hypothetical protein
VRKFSPIFIAVVILTLGLSVGIGVGRLFAGSPDAPGGPTSAVAQMHTLEQIYQRISNGGTFDPAMTSFTEPSTAPGTGTMHSLEEIYSLLAFSAHVPRTGPTLCPCGPGDREDSKLRRGVLWPVPRFVDNGNGTVTDKLTGLIWLKNANCFGTRTWDQALSNANNLANGQCSLTDGSVVNDWRLPNVRELLSLIDYTVHTPAIPTANPFTGVQGVPPNSSYWSSTAVANNALAAWNIDFDIGTVNRNQPKTSLFYVWPVRGGEDGQ